MDIKLCMVSREYPPNIWGGVGVCVYEFSKRLAKKIDVSVITLSDELKLETKNRLSIHAVHSTHDLYQLNFAKKAKEIAKKIKPDLTIVWDISYAVFSFPKPVVAVVGGTALGEIPYSHTLVTKLFWWYPLTILSYIGFRKVDYAIAVSNYIKEEISTSFSFPKERIFVIPNGVDTHLFNPKAPPAPIKRGNRRLVLYVGRLTKRKGLFEILEAAKKMREFDFALVGTGLRASEVFKRRAEAEELRNVFFLGQVDHESVPNYLSAADVCVFPSFYEPFGIAILEAMASGKPVIASKVGGIPEFLSGAGIFLPSIDANSIKKSLLSLLENDELMRDLSTKARNRALQYDWDIIADRTLTLLEKILRKN